MVSPMPPEQLITLRRGENLPLGEFMRMDMRGKKMVIGL